MSSIKSHPTFRELEPELPKKIMTFVDDHFGAVKHRISEVGLFGSFASPFKPVTEHSDIDVAIVVSDWENTYALCPGPWLFPDSLLKHAIQNVSLGGVRHAEAMVYGTREEIEELELSDDMEEALRKTVLSGGIEAAGSKRYVDVTVMSPEQADDKHREGSLAKYYYVPVWRSGEDR